ncbi:sodium/hydrogen exchanger 7-like isoform 1-T1 [Glossina fuscipes fuscipes]
MLFFAGLRGAMSFALAIRNTLSEARQTMLTATSLIVIFTVIIQGGAANLLLNWLKIPVGVDEETEQLNNYQVRSSSSCLSPSNSINAVGIISSAMASLRTGEKFNKASLLALYRFENETVLNLHQMATYRT